MRKHAPGRDRRSEGAVKKHVLTETNYCATMYESLPVEGRYRCTAAGRYIDIDGRAICARCAAGCVVVKLTDAPKLISLVDRLIDQVASKDPRIDDLCAQLRALVAVAPEGET